MQAIQRVSSTRLEQPVQNADLNLFIWSILTNRIEIAKLFWRKGEVSFLSDSHSISQTPILRFFLLVEPNSEFPAGRNAAEEDRSDG